MEKRSDLSKVTQLISEWYQRAGKEEGECSLKSFHPNTSEKQAAIFYSICDANEKTYPSIKPNRE